MDFHEDQRQEALNYQLRAIKTNNTKHANYVKHLINMPRMVPQGSLNMMIRHSANDVYGWGETPFDNYRGGAITQQGHEFYRNQLKRRAEQLEQQELDRNNYFLGGLPPTSEAQNTSNNADDSSKISLELYFNELIDGGFSNAEISKENARKAIGNLNRIGLSLSKSDLDRYYKILSEILDKFAFQARNPEFNNILYSMPQNTLKYKKEWDGLLKPLLQNIEGIEGVYKVYLIIVSLQQSWGQDSITRENIFTEQFNEIIKANPIELLPPEIKATVKNVRDHLKRNGLKISNLIKDMDDKGRIVPFKGVSSQLLKEDKERIYSKALFDLSDAKANEIRSDDSEEYAELKRAHPTQIKLRGHILKNIKDFFNDGEINDAFKTTYAHYYQSAPHEIRQNRTLPDSTSGRAFQEAEEKTIRQNKLDTDAERKRQKYLQKRERKQERKNYNHESKLIDDFHAAVDELTKRIAPKQVGSKQNLIIKDNIIERLDIDDLNELNDAINYAFKLVDDISVFEEANLFRTNTGKMYERQQDLTSVLTRLRSQQKKILERIQTLNLQERERRENPGVEEFKEQDEEQQEDTKEDAQEDEQEELEGQGAIRINTRRRHKKRSPKSKPKRKNQTKNTKKKIGGANLGALLL